MTFQEFPLAWRWTYACYAVFPPDVLAQLSPCSLDEAFSTVRAHKDLARSDDPAGAWMSADGSHAHVTAWLRAQHGRRSCVLVERHSIADTVEHIHPALERFLLSQFRRRDRIASQRELDFDVSPLA